MKKLKILVFPCGSEIGLEIHRSLSYSAHIELIGASSVDDHGKFVYENYIGNIPFIDSQKIITYLAEIVKQNQIDAIYPTMDKVIWKLKTFEKELECVVISSPQETTAICLSKKRTYKKLIGTINVPKTYQNLGSINVFPVFVKPVIGYGTRGVFKADSIEDLKYFFAKNLISDYVVSGYLPGDEYTVDCFTDKNGRLLFYGPRIRQRIKNGISVNTKPITEDDTAFQEIAQSINNSLTMRGAWFFQVKRDSRGNLTLMEVAARLGGSSSIYRGRGVNFALLSVYDAFDIDVEIIENAFYIELDRALDNKYKLDLQFSIVYVDFDDCLIINGKVNVQLLSFLYDCVNKGKKIILITKHEKNIHNSLAEYRLTNLFDEIIHISKKDNKVDYLSQSDSILIDDSFQERKNVHEILKIPVFSPDMVETL